MYPFIYEIYITDEDHHLLHFSLKFMKKCFLPLKSVNELLEVKDTVAVLVELSKESDSVLLQRFVVGGTSLYLGDDAVERGLRENVRVVLHIFLGILVGLHKLEFEASQEDGMSEEEVSLVVVVVADRVEVLLALHELATDAARVFVADLVYLDGIVSAVEGNDETAAFIIRLGGNELGFKAEDVHVLLEHLFHIELGDFWLESNYTSHRVFFSSVAS